MEPSTDFVALLRRWEGAGGVWKVLGRDRDAVTVGLYRCDGGEEAGRFTSDEARLLSYVGDRESSED